MIEAQIQKKFKYLKRINLKEIEMVHSSCSFLLF